MWRRSNEVFFYPKVGSGCARKSQTAFLIPVIGATMWNTGMPDIPDSGTNQTGGSK